MRARYRIRQFVSGLSRSKPVEPAVWAPYLNDTQRVLFRSLPPSEQQHACQVLCVLQQTGHDDPALAQAALLHDVGKVLPNVGPGQDPQRAAQGQTRMRIRAWHRVVVVLLRAMHPRLYRRVALGGSDDWRYPIAILLRHAAIGADLAAKAGSDPLAVALIRCHHTEPQMTTLDARAQDMLEKLQSADEQV